jgi:heat shock protein HslJ
MRIEPEPFMRDIGRLVVLAILLALGGAAQAQEFPYDRDLVLDARAMRGSKRLPVIAIGADGQAQIDLWCKRGQGRAEITGDAITITIGTMRDEPCTAERQQADEEMLAALAGVTGWSARGDVVTLTGAKPLRFRTAAN